MNETGSTIDLEDEQGGLGGNETAPDFNFDNFPEPPPDWHELPPLPDSSPSKEAPVPQEVLDYVNENFGDGWELHAEFNPAEMQSGTFDGENWHTQDGLNLTEHLRAGSNSDKLAEHEQILSDLKQKGTSEVITQADGKQILTLNYVIGNSIISLTFTKELPKPEPQPEPEPAPLDDGDGLDDNAELAALGLQPNAENLSVPGLQEANTVVSASAEKNSTEIAGQFFANVAGVESITARLQTEHRNDLDLIPPPQRGTASSERSRGEKDKSLGDERGLIELEFSPLPSPPPQGEGKSNTEIVEAVADSVEELDDLELTFDVEAIKAAAVQGAVVTEQSTVQHLFVDARGYEVMPEAQAIAESEPDIFEQTKTTEIREQLEPYLREMNRHMEISISGDSANGVTVIENPTEAKIRLAESLYEEDLKNQELYGGLTEAAFNAQKRAVEREKEIKEEEEIKDDPDSPRGPRNGPRDGEPDEEEIESHLKYLEAMAAEGEANADTGDKETKDRGDDSLKPILETVRGYSRVVADSRVVEIREGEETRQAEQAREIQTIERTTGISISRGEPMGEQQETIQTEPETTRRSVQNSITQTGSVVSINAVQRDEGAVATQDVKSPEMRAIEDESGIQLIFENQQDEQRSNTGSAENFTRSSVASVRSNSPALADELGNESEYTPGNEGLRLAA